jgi:hypothetical protein
MKKKTASKGKGATKKAAKQSKKGAVKKELNPGQVLKDISLMIEEAAPKIAGAVIGESIKGQLSPARYLFEMAHIFPQAADGSQTSEREESLAETLLDRLKIPKTPVVHDELQKEDDEDVMVMKPKKDPGGAGSGESRTEEKKDGEGAEESEKDEQKEAAVVH